MDYINKICPSCRAKNTYNSSLEEGFCAYCGTKITLTEGVVVKDSPDIMLSIENELAIGNNKTAQFRELINRARELHPENQEIAALFESKIWDADIESGDLVSYFGDAKKFTVPRCIKRLRRKAFADAKCIKVCKMHENLEFIGTNLFPKDCNILIESPDSDCIAARFACICGYECETPRDCEFSGAFGKISAMLSAISGIYINGKRQIAAHYEKLADNHLTRENGRTLKSNRNLFLILMFSCFGLSYFTGFLTPYLLLALIPAVVFMVLTIVYDKKYQLYLTASNISRFTDHDTKNWTKTFIRGLNDAFSVSGHINGYDFWNKTESELLGDEMQLTRIYDYFKSKSTAPRLSYISIQKNMFIVPQANDTVSKSMGNDFLAVLDGCGGF